MILFSYMCRMGVCGTLIIIGSVQYNAKSCVDDTIATNTGHGHDDFLHDGGSSVSIK